MERTTKRIVLLLVILLAVTGVVVAQGMWKDGTYTAEGDAFSHGWKNMVRLVVVNGYIVDAHFDAIPEDGGMYKYLESVQGIYGMVANGGAQSKWFVQADAAAAELLNVQDSADLTGNAGAVDAISGVSITIMPHFELAQKALQNARR